MGLFSTLQHAWNVFRNKDPSDYSIDSGPTYFYRPDRVHLSRGNERSIVSAVYNRIALDVASLDIRHVRLDDNKCFLEEIKSNLNYCFTDEANLDQSSRAFLHDIVLSLFDEGCIAIVPIDTTLNPKTTGSYDIVTMRTASIENWKPDKIKIKVYNETTGLKESVDVPKRLAAIVENPFYVVMNEPSSTLQRLIRKLNLLDAIDEQNGSGKLDLIIQLPYVIKTASRREQAENRRKDIETQLAGSKYGIAYTDGTEKITQLNRPVENNLMSQIEYLTSMLYSQLGLSQSILDGTADEKTMNNYFHNTVEPVITIIVEEMRRKFLTKTARTQGQSIMFFRDSFKLIPISQMADIVDKFSRNEIMSANEFRQVIGRKPSAEPNADELRNKNMPVDDTKSSNENSEVKEEIQNGL